MNKRFSVRNEASRSVTEYLGEHPKTHDGMYMRKGALIEEVRYYFERHEAAGYPIPLGLLEMELDHASVIALDNRPYQCQVLGIWDKAVKNEQKQNKRKAVG